MRVRVSAISYLNTIPFIYGLENHPVSNKIELIRSTPEICARELLSGEVDIGIVPSVVIPRLGCDRIISDYCIGAEGKVASVLLCSNEPIGKIENIYLDSESRTSVMLLKILFSHYWKSNPIYSEIDIKKHKIDRGSSYLLIGDKAMESAPLFKYVYDLGEEWLNFKGLPFVFACWVSNRNLEDSFVNEFNEALLLGLNNIELSLKTIPHNFGYDTALNYLTNNISYILDSKKRKALVQFWTLSNP